MPASSWRRERIGTDPAGFDLQGALGAGDPLARALLVFMLVLLPLPSHAQDADQTRFHYAGARGLVPLIRESYWTFRFDKDQASDTDPGLDISSCEEVAWRFNPTTEESLDKKTNPDVATVTEAIANLKECATASTAIASCTLLTPMQETFTVVEVGDKLKPAVAFREKERFKPFFPSENFLKVEVVETDSDEGAAFPDWEMISDVVIRCRTRVRDSELGPHQVFQDWEYVGQNFSNPNDVLVVDAELCTDSFDSSCTDVADSSCTDVADSSCTDAYDQSCTDAYDNTTCPFVGPQTSGNPDGWCDATCIRTEVWTATQTSGSPDGLCDATGEPANVCIPTQMGGSADGLCDATCEPANVCIPTQTGGSADGLCDATCLPVGVCDPGTTQTAGSPDGLCDAGCAVRPQAGPWRVTEHESEDNELPTNRKISQHAFGADPYEGHTGAAFRGGSNNEGEVGATWTYDWFSMELDVPRHFGQPRELVWWADVALNSNGFAGNNYFAGIAAPDNDPWNDDGTLDGDPVGIDGDPTAQLIGFWFDGTTGDIFAVAADTIVLYTPVDTGFDMVAGGTYRLRMEYTLKALDVGNTSMGGSESKVAYFVNDVKVHEYADLVSLKAIYVSPGQKPAFGVLIENTTQRPLRVSNWGTAHSLSPDGRDQPE